MTSLDSVVGELHIVSGQRQKTPQFTGAFTAPRRSARGRQDDTLFVLIDPSGSHVLVPDLIQRIQHAYWHATGSVTAGLRAAIEAGNAWLIEQNQSAVAATRAGVTCAVLRGSEAFIAQAGSASAYVAHQGQVERFPRGDGGSLPSLGIARAIEIRFSHAELHPGDVILLTDGSFPTRMPIEAVTSSIVYVGVEAALNNLTRLSGSDSVTAMLIEVAAAQPIEVKAAPAPHIHTSVAPQKTSAPPPKPAVEAPAKMPAPKAGEWAGALKQGVGRGLGSLGAGAKTMVERALPDRPAPRQRARRGPAPIERNTLLMTGLAIGIPILIAILVTAVYLDRSRAAHIDTLLNEARQALAAADVSVSNEVKRERWQAALSKTAEALTIDPQNVAALELRTQAQAQIDQLDGTVRVSPVLLYDFKKVSPYRLARSDIYLFVLDPMEDRVDRLTLTADGGAIEGSGPAPVMSRGIAVGKRSVSDLIDLAWVEPGGARQQRALIVLDRSGPIEYDLAFGLSATPFAEAAMSAGVRRMDTFDGNLYLLDANALQVWRYTPSADGGYSGLPDAYFVVPPDAIKDAIDLAIDGSVYFVESNGRLHKYFAGEEDTFSLAGLPAPITRPVALAVDPNRPPGESSVYVADLGGARIVQFAPDGRFVRQIRSTGAELDAIEDIWIDETLSRLYVISGGRVYSAALP